MDQHIASIGLNKSHYCINQGAFASTIWTDKTKDFAFSNLKRNPMHNLSAVKSEREAFFNRHQFNGPTHLLFFINIGESVVQLKNRCA